MDLPIHFKHVFFSFNGGESICADLSFHIPAGRFISLVGASGLGKTTLLRLMMGLLTPQTGAVTIGDMEPAPARLRGLMAYAPQRGALCSWLTALGNVKLAMELTGLRQSMDEKAGELLTAFGLSNDLNKYPHEMSGGMQQRIILAMALGVQRPLVFLDEPFVSLDAVTRMSIYGHLLRGWEEMSRCSTVVMISHDINEAVYLSDYVYVLSERPLRNLTAVEVPLPRPREPAMRFDSAFLATVQRVEAELADVESNPSMAHMPRRKESSVRA